MLTIDGNMLTANVGKCGIILADQSGQSKSGGTYKRRSNNIHNNDARFEGAARASAVSDVGRGYERLHHQDRQQPASTPPWFGWGATCSTGTNSVAPDWDGSLIPR